MSEKKKSRIEYAALLCIIAAIILFTGAIFLFTVFKPFCIEYENTLSENAINSYMQQLNDTKWNEAIKAAADSLENESVSRQEAEAIVKDYLSDITIMYYDGRPLSDNSITVDLGSSNGKIGEARFVQDPDEEAFSEGFPQRLFADIWPVNTIKGLHSWKLEEESFDFSFLSGNSTKVFELPSAYTLKLNGTPVGDEYITQRDIELDILSGCYSSHPGLMKKVRYELSGLRSADVIEIFDAGGNPFSYNVSLGDRQFLSACSDTEKEDLRKFMEGEYDDDGFVNAHIWFWGTSWVDSTYPTLLKYVKTGSPLHEAMYEYTLDAATWITFGNVSISNRCFTEAYKIADGLYLASETVDITSYGEYKTVSETGKQITVIVEYDSETGKFLAIDQA